MPNENYLLNMLYQETEKFSENFISNICKPSELPTRSDTPAPPVEHQNLQSLLPSELKLTTPKSKEVSIQKGSLSVIESLPETSEQILKQPSHITAMLQTPSPLIEQYNPQSLLPTQLKPTMPKYQQVSIQKRQLSVVKSLPETSKKVLKQPSNITAMLLTPSPLIEQHNPQSLLSTQLKPTTPKYQQVSIQKRPLSVVESLPETSKKISKKPSHVTATLQTPSPLTEKHNPQSSLPTHLKPTTSKCEQDFNEKILLSSVKFLPEPTRKLIKHQPFTTVANNGKLYNNYVQQEKSNSNRGISASINYDFNQSHQIRPLTIGQSVFTATTESIGQSLQYHNDNQVLIQQTQTPLIEQYNPQSLFPNQLKPTTPKFKISTEMLRQPSHVISADDWNSYYNFQLNNYYNFEYYNRYDISQNSNFVTGNNLNLNSPLNINTLVSGESGISTRPLENRDESNGIYSGGSNNNFQLLNNPEPLSTSDKNFEMLNSYTKNLHEYGSIQNKKLNYYNDLNKNPINKTTPFFSTDDCSKFQLENHNNLQNNYNYTKINMKNTETIMPTSLASSISMESKIMNPIESTANINTDHDYSTSEIKIIRKKIKKKCNPAKNPK